MTLKHKVLDLITEADLQGLIDNKVREAKVLEYKRDLPGNQDRQKREFLYDVSSFANASGGDLIFGVTEIDGVASELTGLESGSIDDDILRLESIIRNSIEPRILGVSIHAVNVRTTRVVLIVRIPKSFALPHVIRSRVIENALTKGLERYMRVQEKLGVEPPLFVMLTLLGVAGYRLDQSDFDDHTIDRSDLIIPEVRVDEFSSNPHEVMRPIFDSIWNAAGWFRDMNYDEDGKWISRAVG